MNLKDFDYHLPKGLIAQAPLMPRESAKLMRVSRSSSCPEHLHIRDLPKLLRAGDVLVVNDTKVFRARLHGSVEGTGGSKPVELFLIREVSPGNWSALGKPGKKILPHATVAIAPDFRAEIIDKMPDGSLIVSFGIPSESVIAKANIYGDIPVPPYIKRSPNEEEYQTVYAQRPGSVAAPTAGFHLTRDLLATVRASGIIIGTVTLHVGLGTFLPIHTATIEEHVMHSEWVEIPENTAGILTHAKHEDRRVIAVGTTTVRALEGSYQENGNRIASWKGNVRLFIRPGFRFQVVDAMVTNFHLPKSTLLLLVSAFSGTEKIRSAYGEAVSRGYRFYSFGDAMFLE